MGNGWPVFGDEKGKVPLKFVKPGQSSFETEVVKSDEFYQEKAESNPRRFEVKRNAEITKDVELVINNNLPEAQLGGKAEKEQSLRL